MGNMSTWDGNSNRVTDAPRVIYPTPEELTATSYDVANIIAALEALHQDGIVVLKSVVIVSYP
jgi:hypothetical protein